MMGHKAAKVPFALLSQISVTLRKSKHSSASVKKQHRFNQPKICSQLKTRKKIIIICSSYLLCKHILNLLTLAVPWPRYAFISYAALFCFCRTLPNFISIKNLDNKSSSQRSKTLLFHFESFPLCEHAFFKKGFSFFFFVNDEYLVFREGLIHFHLLSSDWVRNRLWYVPSNNLVPCCLFISSNFLTSLSS